MVVRDQDADAVDVLGRGQTAYKDANTDPPSLAGFPRRDHGAARGRRAGPELDGSADPPDVRARRARAAGRRFGRRRHGSVEEPRNPGLAGIPRVDGAPAGGDTCLVESRRERDGGELRARDRSRYEFMQRATQDAVWDWDVASNDAWWNDRQYELLGYDRGVTPGFEVWVARIHPDDRARVIASFERFLTSAESRWEDEYRLQLPGGRVVALVDSGYVERDHAGRPVRVIGVARDVTAIRAAERGLRESEERFRQIAESIDAVFYLVNRTGTELIYVSPAYETIWGRPCRELYQELDRWQHAIEPEDRPLVNERRLERQLAGEFDVTYRVRRPDGTLVWIRDRAFPVRDARGAVIRIAGVATDVTAVRELEAQVAQMQKLDSIGRLAGGIAHDFNNLLTVILTAGDLLARSRALAGSARDDLDQIQLAAQRAAALTRQLLAFARRQPAAATEVDLNAVCAESEQLLRRLIGERIELVTVLDRELGAVRADRAQLEQVVLNLAVNARDAMVDGGRLTVATGNQTVRRPIVEPQARVEPGEYVVLAVSDQGTGITPEVRAHLFEPFFTTKPAGQGTGLGLATVYGIVRAAGGQILVDSGPGRGATFRVFLPRIARATTAPALTALPGPAGTGETVLVVEDEPIVRTAAARALARHGYRVIEAGDGQQALARCRDLAGAVDLVIADVIMPGMPTGDLVAALREACPRIRVVLTSGYDGGAARGAASHASHGFLAKPYSTVSLLAHVREALDR